MTLLMCTQTLQGRANRVNRDHFFCVEGSPLETSWMVMVFMMFEGTQCVPQQRQEEGKKSIEVWYISPDVHTRSHGLHRPSMFLGHWVQVPRAPTTS